MCFGALMMVVVGGSETMKIMERGGCEGCERTCKDVQERARMEGLAGRGEDCGNGRVSILMVTRVNEELWNKVC